MAHIEQARWAHSLKKRFPQYFKNTRVLEIGSLNINGSDRRFFENCEYIGLDLVAGKDVDVICVAHEYNPGKLFDVVLSNSSLEHDIYYQLTLKKMVNLVRPGGLLYISVPNSWAEHGTKRNHPDDSGTTKMGEDWENYYKNLEIEDITNTIDLNLFKLYGIEMEMCFYRNGVTELGKDLRFWGIKYN